MIDSLITLCTVEPDEDISSLRSRLNILRQQLIGVKEGKILLSEFEPQSIIPDDYLMADGTARVDAYVSSLMSTICEE